MATERIDIHKSKHNYEKELARLGRDEGICSENKQIIVDFLNACQLGKTILGKEKKKLGEKRLIKYLYALRRINEWLGNKNFKEVTQAEMEAFISRVERNALCIGGKQVAYTEWTRRDIKVCVKKFYKWLLGGGQQYPSLVSWIDTHIKEDAPSSLSVEEVRKLAEHAHTWKTKALVWSLFETGARVEELLNVRLLHVEDKGTHVVLRIEHSKTFPRSLPVYEGSSYVREWMAQHPAKHNGEAQLFPIEYAALCKRLRTLSMYVLGKRVTPHLLRHSFATWLASKKVGRYQMCKLMGWAMSSDMPDRYIDRLGLVEEEAIASIREDELSKAERENVELKRVLQRLEGEQQELREQWARRERADELVNDLFGDKEVLMMLAQKIKEKGLGERLMGL
jgi:site-specific recombinase XerD